MKAVSRTTKSPRQIATGATVGYEAQLWRMADALEEHHTRLEAGRAL